MVAIYIDFNDLFIVDLESSNLKKFDKYMQ